MTAVEDIVRLLFLLILAGCEFKSVRRCVGQSLEQFGYNDQTGDDEWQVFQVCGAGEVCREMVVDKATTGELADWGYCTSPNPDPYCAPATGRRCVDATHIVSCVQGFRIAPTTACYKDTPFCVEPEPGLAFCVADPKPSPICAGRPTHAMEVCATDNAACVQAQLQQFCTTERMSVTCFHDILLRTQQCHGPIGDPTGDRCIVVDALTTSNCSYPQ